MDLVNESSKKEDLFYNVYKRSKSFFFIKRVLTLSADRTIPMVALMIRYVVRLLSVTYVLWLDRKTV